MVLSKEKDLARKNSANARGRDIGPIPPPVNLDRRDAAFNSLRVFCETYLFRIFRKPWSPAHLRAIDRFEYTINGGGLFALAMPRGGGKTALARAAVLWAVLTGRRRYVLFICATTKLAKRSMKAFKSSLQGNKLLAEDFPEACFPVKKLGRMPQKANGQTCCGEPTDIQWTDEFIQLANIPGSKCAGCILDVVGITGAIRGRNVELATGEQVRPDYAVIDDVQTKKSAKNPRLVEDTIEVIQSDVLGSTAPDVKMAGVGLFTVIYPDDAADQLLNRDLYKAWHGERVALLESMPTNIDTLWKRYRELLYADLKQGDEQHRSATAYYLLNQEQMNAGAKETWKERFVEGEVSAIQHAMNLLFTRGEATFWSEYQNQPRRNLGNDNQLTVDGILSRCSGVPRGIVPSECDKLNVFIDVHDDVFYWAVCAWNSSVFGGSIIDFGAFPEQPTDFFTNQDIKVKLIEKLGCGSLEEAWYQGLTELTGILESRTWSRDGTELLLDKGLIDANYGNSSEVVYQFCRSRPSTLWIPSHGRYVGENSTPFNDLPRKEGETVGQNWKIPLPNPKRFTRHVSWDGNFWKSFVKERLKIPLGSKSALSVFGVDENELRMLADHCTAEAFTRKLGGRQVVDIWKARPGRTENHWWDCIVGCAVGGSMSGCTMLDSVPVVQRKKRNLAEEQRLARLGHG